MTIRAGLVLGLGLLAAVPVAAQTPRPSPSPPGGKTPSYTSDDLDRIAGRKPGEAGATPAHPAPTEPAPGGAVENGTAVPDIPIVRADENATSSGGDPLAGPPPGWGERAQTLRDDVSSAEAKVKDLESQAQSLLWQYLQSTDTNEILRLKADQQDIIDQIPDAKKAVEAAQKALEDFLKEAAQAGVPPSELKEKEKPAPPSP